MACIYQNMVRLNKACREKFRTGFHTKFVCSEISSISDVSTTDLVSFNDVGRCLLATGANTQERLDAHAALLGPGGHEAFLLNMEVQK